MMQFPRLTRVAALLLSAALLLASEPAPAQARAAGTALTPEQVQSRIAAVRDSREGDEAARARAIELYQQAVANLEATRTNRQAAEEFRKAADAAPQRTASIRASIERKRDEDPVAALGIKPTLKLERIEQDLESELANLAAIEARLAALEASLESESRRPTLARERISAARALLEEALAAVDSRPPADQGPFVAEAERWAGETRVEVLRSEIASLDEELLTHGVRLELLQAQRDEAALGVRRATLRVEALRAAVGERRRSEAELAMAQARAVLDGDAADYPALRALAQANLALVERLQLQLEELEALSQRERELRPLSSSLAESFRSTRRKLELKGSGAPLGQAILEQRLQLPAAEAYALERRRLQRPITDISLRLIDHEDERRALRDLDAYMDGLVARAGARPPEPALRLQLVDLVKTRRGLLGRAIANDYAQQRSLFALDDRLKQLEERTLAYDAFLAERLLWVKSTPGFGLEGLATLPAEITAFLDPGPWADAGDAIVKGLQRSPWLALLFVGAAILWLRRGRLLDALRDCGADVGSIRRDRMSATWRAAGLTLLLALPGTLVLVALAWAMALADTVTPLLARTLLDAATALLLATLLLVLSLPGGLAERHFGWNTATTAELRHAFAWFRAVYVPLLLLDGFALALDPSTYGGTLGDLLALGAMLAVLVLTGRLLHPTRGVIRRYLEGHQSSRWWRWRYLWFAAVVAIPLAMVVAGLTGYTYAAIELGRRWAPSAWLLTAAWLGGELVRRWLLVTRRRLVFDAAMKERDAARARRALGKDAHESPEPDDNDIGAPEVDLLALDADSRKVVNAALMLLAALGLAAIWGDILPAFKVLNEVTLWSVAFKAEGVDALVSVTLADALIALLIGVVGYVLAVNLPSLIDIILLKQGTVSAGSRYAITSVTKYVIVIVATLMVIGRLGATWSQMGWAAAALGVGVGFGLQEIVANFISGLILLAERPVRVGDLITVGDASGIVQRIRIRATTIRDFEQKELLIPNKELITGRLLNWTLTDARTRILVQVGIAYGSDVDRAIAILLELAEQDERVLDDPPPGVVFDQFGDSSLNLAFRVFVGTLADRLPVMTDMHRRIHSRFAEEGIVIAFPQRDVHVYDQGATDRA